MVLQMSKSKQIEKEYKPDTRVAIVPPKMRDSRILHHFGPCSPFHAFLTTFSSISGLNPDNPDANVLIFCKV